MNRFTGFLLFFFMTSQPSLCDVQAEINFFSFRHYINFSLTHLHINPFHPPTYCITSPCLSDVILSLFFLFPLLPPSLPHPLNSLSFSELISLELVAVMSVTQALIQLHGSPQSFWRNLPSQLLGENIKSGVHICVCMCVYVSKFKAGL